MEQEYKYSMWCISPSCENTTKKTPNKLFFRVPIEEKRRRLWINAVRRHYSEFSKTSSLFVCEDHFNVEEDMENYVKWKLMGGQKKLKSHVVPHIFACQRDRKRAAPRSPRQASTKRSQKQYIQDILSAASSSSNNGPSVELDESNANNAQYVQLLNSSEREPSTSTASPKRFTTCYTQTESPPQKPYYRSKEVQCCPSRTSVACTAKPICVDAATSPSAPEVVRVPSKRLIFADSADSDSDSSEGKTSKMYDSDTSTDFCLESDCLSAETDGEESTELLQRLKKQALETTMQLVPLKCRFYLGLGKDAYFIINLLQKYTPAPIANIFITLKKIRTNATFGSLADDFGMSESSVSRAFSKTITHLSGNLSKFIKWYSKRQLKQLLPIAFTAYYSNTVSIIDCLEIEIEKPNDPIHQSLTWSEYKKANTLKYLISCTPNGIINFISIGFGGRASDTIIVEESGFLEKLPPGAAVMADRGFKHIEHLLIERKCSLIRPPTVEKDKKSSKADVLATKRIASLRIHVERVIRRLREFKILKPHSCINSSIIRYTDHMIVIACGLVNMQSALIK